MHLTSDIHHQYVLDRQQRLRAEAAAHRLVHPIPSRTRISRILCHLADRLDLSIGRCRPGRTLPERA